MKRTLVAALVLANAQTSCVVGGGYSDERGWFFWPWGLVLPALIVLALLLLRRRRR